MAEPLLEITDLYITAEDGTEILNGVTLLINEGETHALMGPNGCGKSTFASTLLGSPEYVVTRGTIRYKGQDITELDSSERGKLGMFWHSNTHRNFQVFQKLNFSSPNG